MKNYNWSRTGKQGPFKIYHSKKSIEKEKRDETEAHRVLSNPHSLAGRQEISALQPKQNRQKLGLRSHIDISLFPREKRVRRHPGACGFSAERSLADRGGGSWGVMGEEKRVGISEGRLEGITLQEEKKTDKKPKSIWSVWKTYADTSCVILN